MQDTTTMGNVEVLSVLDMYSPGRPVDFFFPDVPKEAWGPYREAQLDENGEIALPYLLFALRSQGQTIMIDTGMGPGPHVSRGNRTGDLINQLKRHGIGPEDVDVVVHTHLHADHVGWNVTYENGQPTATFPKARYLVPRADWDYFTQPDVLAQERNQHVRDYVVPLEGLGVMDIIDPDHVITSEVTTLHTPGHTPGHICVMINSQGQSGAVVGDVFHMSVQIEHPDWCAGVDLDKPTGQHSREQLLERSEQEGMIIAAGHFGVDDHFGRVVRVEGKRYWQVL